MSFADIQMFFGQLSDDPEKPGKFHNEESLSVILTPTNAKLLAVGLASALGAYEAQFGEVKLPIEAQKAVGSVYEQLKSIVENLANSQEKER